MDIAGARALKRRLGPNGADEVPPALVDVPEDAPPVYHWVGVSRPALEVLPGHGEDESSSGHRHPGSS